MSVAAPNAYVVGNFLNSQMYQEQTGAPPMSAAVNVTSGSSSFSEFMDFLTWDSAGEVQSIIQTLSSVTSTNGVNQNPIIIMLNLGNEMINMGFNTWFSLMTIAVTAGAIAGAIPSVTVSTSVSMAFTACFSLLMALVIPLMVAGGMLLYYFPMVPFMIYTFGVIGWLIGVIEGMVAAPIVGIGIMHPEGHDIFGKGDQAIMLLLNMFLRPSLMVFGLITSIMLVYVSVWLINSGISSAIQVINTISTGYTPDMGIIAIPIVYTVMIFSAANKCFAMIHILPDKVTRWLSGGLTESLGSDMAGVQEQVKGGVHSGLSSYAGAIGKGAEGTIGASLELGKGAGKAAYDSSSQAPADDKGSVK
jgi:defect-in-organelle-trafficking protein DotA